MPNILYSNAHTWFLPTGNTALIGITEYAQSRLGPVLFLNLPKPGTKLTVGESFGEIESIKTVSDLISPIDGNVLEINESLIEDPSPINDAPYESWLVKVALNNNVPSGVFIDETAYLKFTEGL